MNPYMILVAGPCAAGKTTFAQYASDALCIPLIRKDIIKKLLWDNEPHQENGLHPNKPNPAIAHKITFYIAEQLMRTGSVFMFDSNFRKWVEATLNELAKRYKYSVITVLFDADDEILHKRYMERDHKADRHDALKIEGVYNDIEVFKNSIAEDRHFGIGDIIKVKTNDFDTVDYDDILRQIRLYIK